jgi:hypothetical protein
VLDPTGLRKELWKLLLRDGNDIAAVIEDDRTGAGGALIESEDEFHEGWRLGTRK